MQHATGKWHAGYASWRNTPVGRGFQSFTGYLQGQTDYFNKTSSLSDAFFRTGKHEGFDFWRCNDSTPCVPFREAAGTYSLDNYMHAASELIGGFAERLKRDESKRLFLHMAHQTVHDPLEPRAMEARCTMADYWRRRQRTDSPNPSLCIADPLCSMFRRTLVMAGAAQVLLDDRRNGRFGGRAARHAQGGGHVELDAGRRRD